MSGILGLIRAPALAFIGSFLVVGGWIWAPQLSRLMPGFSSDNSSGSPSAGSGGSWFASRLGRPETAPVVRSCIFRVVDVGGDARIEPSAAYFILTAGTMQANVAALVGQLPMQSENRTLGLATKWGELATCIYAQDDRQLCDPDNRAAMVEATTNFFKFARQAEAARPLISGSEAQLLGYIGDRLLSAVRNHRRYGTLVAADFSSFVPPEVTRILREEKQTHDICKR